MVAAEHGGDAAAKMPPEALIDWKNIQESALSPPQDSPWSMVAIRRHKDDGNTNPPVVFPPINHENLSIFADPPPTPEKIPRIRQISCSDSDSDSNFGSDSYTSSTFSPSESSPVPLSPVISSAAAAAERVWWLNSWAEVLLPKVKGLVWFFFSSFTSSRGMLEAFRSAALMAVVLAFLRFRRRRRLMDRAENANRLIGIIQERDEKIKQLLDQISRMNQMLLALHKVPSKPTT